MYRPFVRVLLSLCLSALFVQAICLPAAAADPTLTLNEFLETTRKVGESDYRIVLKIKEEDGPPQPGGSAATTLVPTFYIFRGDKPVHNKPGGEVLAHKVLLTTGASKKPTAIHIHGDFELGVLENGARPKLTISGVLYAKADKKVSFIGTGFFTITNKFERLDPPVVQPGTDNLSVTF